jgi:hypothetical protein
MSAAIACRRKLLRGVARCYPWLVTFVILSTLSWATELFADASSGRWQWLQTREGITTWRTERPAQELSAFRAQMLLDADVWTALAILEDVDRACEWTSRCAEMRRLRAISEQELVVYARIDAPWPVRDRDVVVRVSVSYGDDGELLLSIDSTHEVLHEGASGIVRMPRFQAHYRFRVLAAQRTEVEYQVDVDPGGTLPDWLKRMIARDLSHDTLADLRRRTDWALARGEYASRRDGLASLAQARGFRKP